MTNFSSLYGSRLDEELANDDSTQLFTTLRRQNAINRGQREFANLTECYVRKSTVTILSGTAEYNLNDMTEITLSTSGLEVFSETVDFVRFSKEQVEFRYTDASGNVTVLSGKDDLPRRDVEWLNDQRPGWQVSTVSTAVMQLPQVYYERMEGGHAFIGFWPVPSIGSTSTNAGMIARVPYVALPAPMTSTGDEPYAYNSTTRTDLRDYHQGLVHYAAHQLEKLRGELEKSESQLQKFMGYVARYMAQKRAKGGRMVTFARNYFRGRKGDRGTDPRR
jgi:hypothetical protein